MGGWASTNLSLYSGSSVGYLAALIEKTNKDQILQIDLNVTDFYSTDTDPVYLYYNSFSEEKSIQLSLPEGGAFDIRGELSGQLIGTSVTGSIRFTVSAQSVRMLKILPGSVSGIHPLNEISVNIFPNPASDVFNVVLPDHESFMEINLFDSVGKQVLNSRENPVLLPETLKNGVYFMKIRLSSGEVVCRKIILSKK